MLVAAAVCPHPPLLVPGVGAGASGELDDLRAACEAAVAGLVAAEPDLLVVVGAAPAVGPVSPDAWGSLSPYGVDVPVGSGAGRPTLPLALTIGRWLLDRAVGADRGVPHLLFGLAPDTGPRRCLALGGSLAGRAGRVALLVMGDGSARRRRNAPGHPDHDAEPFDAEVERALGAADVAALAALDPARAERLLAAGRAPWQVLAGAARGATWHAELSWSGAPYGVAYVVARWARAG